MDRNFLLNQDVIVPTELVPLIPGYLKRREDDITLLETRLDAGDFESIGRIAHKLQGNGAGYGMPALTFIGQDLSAAAKAGDFSKVREQVTILKEVVDTLKTKLLKYAA